jgi:hypothetical protein
MNAFEIHYLSLGIEQNLERLSSHRLDVFEILRGHLSRDVGFANGFTGTHIILAWRVLAVLEVINVNSTPCPRWKESGFESSFLLLTFSSVLIYLPLLIGLFMNMTS